MTWQLIPDLRPSARPHLQGGFSNHLPRGCVISGKLCLQGPTLIEGEIEGEITAQGSIAIGESAVVIASAPIRAASITVAGKVTGDLVASQRIEIQSTAKVLGILISPVLVIHAGAVFNGNCVMASKEAHRDHLKGELGR
jgi:cytoskeletal protein CcmA (bactofilin family)